MRRWLGIIGLGSTERTRSETHVCAKASANGLLPGFGCPSPDEEPCGICPRGDPPKPGGLPAAEPLTPFPSPAMVSLYPEEPLSAAKPATCDEHGRPLPDPGGPGTLYCQGGGVDSFPEMRREAEARDYARAERHIRDSNLVGETPRFESMVTEDSLSDLEARIAGEAGTFFGIRVSLDQHMPEGTIIVIGEDGQSVEIRIPR